MYHFFNPVSCQCITVAANEYVWLLQIWKVKWVAFKFTWPWVNNPVHSTTRWYIGFFCPFKEQIRCPTFTVLWNCFIVNDSYFEDCNRQRARFKTIFQKRRGKNLLMIIAICYVCSYWTFLRISFVFVINSFSTVSVLLLLSWAVVM